MFAVILIKGAKGAQIKGKERGEDPFSLSLSFGSFSLPINRQHFGRETEGLMICVAFTTNLSFSPFVCV